MKITNLGMPNVHESLIKKAVEGFWGGKRTIDDIIEAEQQVASFNLNAQSKLDLVPVFDFDIYDRLLRTAVIFGIVPQRFGTPEQANQDLRVYFSIPRGTANAPASPMVKWFNNNYHVVQPEIEQDPLLAHNPRLPDLNGTDKKLALIGPWTFLSYAINKTGQSQESLFEKLSEQYISLINSLQPNAIVQLEEPSFLTHGIPKNYKEFIKKLEHDVHLHVYFEAVNRFAEELFAIPVKGFGLDFVDGYSNLELLSNFPKDKILIAGIINGRNVWPAPIRTQETIETILKHINNDRLYISPSCPLMHVPLSAKYEDKEHFLSFALEKLSELEAIKNGTIVYRDSQYRDISLPTERYERSRKTFWVSNVPFPATTIGSFPQTPELRKTRKLWKKREVSDGQYNELIKKLIKYCIRQQEELGVDIVVQGDIINGLDLFVHGEFEREDMVKYPAKHLDGFVTIEGVVQSYGTRHVRPPVITGHISRPKPFSVEWIEYAQSLTKKPVKGILTGPVTMVQWSYPREDISRESQMYEVARALSQEVNDLVKAGIKHIQIDEPALREGLPLDASKKNHYLEHAVNAFRLTYANVPDEIIVHSHMCFSQFPNIIDAIKDMGVDVLSIEESKSGGRTATYLVEHGFPGSIGLGVFDVHSPRIPSIEEMVNVPKYLVNSGIDPHKIWFNPDCGGKTRGTEFILQLKNMLEARHRMIEYLR